MSTRDRDRDSFTRKTPPAGVAAQIAAPDREVKDDSSGAITNPEERHAYRAKRSTHERIDRLETKADKHGEVLAELKATTTSVNDRLGLLIELGDRAEAARNAEAAAEVNRANAIIAAKERADDRRRKFWVAMGKTVVSIVTAVGIAFAAYKAAGK